MKRCPKCTETKPLIAFSKSSTTLDGYHGHCKQCVAAALRASYAKRGKKSWTEESQCVRCDRLLPKSMFAKHGRSCSDCLEYERQQHAIGLKQCNLCSEWLTHDKFYVGKIAVYRTACAECTRAYARANPDARRAKTLMKEYGMTTAMYDELVAKQGGKCPVCLGSLEPGNRSYHVDHAHTGVHAGRIRGIVHSECNRVVLWMHDDPTQLRNAANLVENPLTDWYVPGKPQSEKRGELARARRAASQTKAATDPAD